MKITETSILAAQFKPGDVLWGCSYCHNENGEEVINLPRKGILSDVRYEKESKQGSAGPVSYFIPLKADGKTPAWKKAVKAYALKYATTQDECEEIYNDMINSCIEMRKNEIARMRRLLIKRKPNKGSA